jgi:cytochrome P450
VVGNLPEVVAERRRDTELGRVLGVFDRWRREFGRLSYHALGPVVRLTVAEPELVRGILISHNECYHKPELMVRALSPLMGRGLLLSEDSFHASQRRLVQPAFDFRNLERMVGDMTAAARRAEKRWRERLSTESPECLYMMNTEFGHITADIITVSAFGAGEIIERDPERAAAVFKSLRELLAEFLDSFVSGRLFFPLLFRVTRWLPRVRSNIAVIEETLKEMIDKRLDRAKSNTGASVGRQTDLLQLLVTAHIEDSKAAESQSTMTRGQVRDEVGVRARIDANGYACAHCTHCILPRR